MCIVVFCVAAKPLALCLILCPLLPCPVYLSMYLCTPRLPAPPPTHTSMQVCVLRNYLGTALLHAYELRHLSLKKLLVAQSAAAGAGAGGGAAGGMLDLDADLYLTTYSRSVMLEWVDALWSCFLEVGVCVCICVMGWLIWAGGSGVNVLCD